MGTEIKSFRKAYKMGKISNTKTYVKLTISTVFGASAFIAAKFAVPYLPTATLTFLRFGIAAAFLFFLSKGKYASSTPYTLQKKHIPFLAFTGIVGFAGYHMLFFIALKYTLAMNASILMGINPIFTTILAAIIIGGKIPPMQIFGIILSFVGAILTITGADFSIIASFAFNKGEIIMLTGVILWAVYLVGNKALNPGIPPFFVTYYSFVFCSLFLLPFVIIEKPWTFILDVPFSAWAAILFMAIFPSVISYLIQQAAIGTIGPARTSIFLNLVPVFSIILSCIFSLFIKVISNFPHSFNATAISPTVVYFFHFSTDKLLK